jgi:thiol:disulfide interchange protein
MTGIRPLSALVALVVAAPLAAAQTLTMTSSTASTSSPAPAATVAADTVPWVELSSKQGELRGKLPQLVAAEIAKAKASGLTPFLEVGATWCGPCQALEASLHNKDMVDAFAGAYVIHLDVNEWDTQDEMAPLGIEGGGMPFVVAINPKGHAVAQLKGESTAAPIKQFVQAHLWKSTTTASKHVASN